MHASIRFCVIMMFIIFSLFTSVNFTSNNVEGVGQTTYHVIRILEGEEEQIAKVGPDDDGKAVFPGLIDLREPVGGEEQNYTVNLFAITSSNWPVEITPSTLIVRSNTQAFFNVTVTVPPRTSYYVQNSLTVNGTATNEAGNETYPIGTITGTIRIAQFYEFDAEAMIKTIILEKGESEDIDIEIWNYGNGRDTFVLSVKNLDELAEDGIEVSLVTYTIEIDESAKNIVEMDIDTSSGTGGGIYTIELEVKSEQQEILEGSAIPETVSIELNVGPTSGPHLDTGNASVEGDAPSNTFLFIVLSIVVLIIVVVLAVIGYLIYSSGRRSPPQGE